MVGRVRVGFTALGLTIMEIHVGSSSWAQSLSLGMVRGHNWVVVLLLVGLEDCSVDGVTIEHFIICAE